MTPRVTVLIDTYNYGRFIEEAIDSVVSEDFSEEELEILVVDDGSTDDTEERVKKYGERLRYFYKSNGGQASAFNFGFANARGEIVALLDADDRYQKGKLSRIVREFERCPQAVLLVHSRIELNTNTGESRQMAIEAFEGFLPGDRRAALAYELPPTSCIAFRRATFANIFPMPESIKLQADAYLGILGVLLGDVILLPEALSLYRIHGGNLYFTATPSKSRERRLCHIATFASVLEAARGWTKLHAELTVLADLGWFFERWALVFEQFRFEVNTPGRWEYFIHLLRQNKLRSDVQTRKFTIMNYLTAISALVLEYRSVPSYREKMAQTVSERFRRFMRSSSH